MSKWWANRREVIMRLKALANQLRCFPHAITHDLDTRIKLNKIGKALDDLADCLLAIEIERVLEKEPEWYKRVMMFWKIRKCP